MPFVHFTQIISVHPAFSFLIDDRAKFGPGPMVILPAG